MGVSTYTLACSGVELREGTESAAKLAVMNAAAAAGCRQWELAEAVAFFGIDEDNDFPSLGLFNERAEYFSEAPKGFKPGTGQYLLAQAIAPFVVPGCWHIYESDGEPWALVFDGSAVHETGILPQFYGVPLILDGGERVTMTPHKAEGADHD